MVLREKDYHIFYVIFTVPNSSSETVMFYTCLSVILFTMVSAQTPPRLGRHPSLGRPWADTTTPSGQTPPPTGMHSCFEENFTLLCRITSNYQQIWRSDQPISFIVSSIVRGINE